MSRHDQHPAPDQRSRAAAWARRSLPELDGLRGVAITLVFLFHAEGFVIDGGEVSPGWSPATLFVHGGHSGVTLFFVLSAFLLARPFLAALDGAPRPVARHFFVRRARRILPLYWSAVVVTAAVSGVRGAAWLGVAPYLFFLQGIPDFGTRLLARLQPVPLPLGTPWWSLATEAQFYLLLPLLGVVIAARRRRALAWAAAVTAVLVWAACVLGAGASLSFSDRWRIGTSVVGRGPAFAAGIAAAWLDLRFSDRIGAWVGRQPVLAWRAGLGLGGAALAFLAMVLAAALSEPLPGRELAPWIAWHAPESLAWAALLLVTLWLPWPGRGALRAGLLPWLGVHSYSIYLLHYPVLVYGTRWARLYGLTVPPMSPGQQIAAWAWLAVVTVGCLGLSRLSHRWIEQPFLARRAGQDAGQTAPR